MVKLISIVVPAFNEQRNIPIIYESLKKTLDLLSDYTYEIIFVDDGSSDSSWAVINTLVQENSHVRGIKLSRNFGHQIALSAGYNAAKGDIIISLDADLQHPPEVIPEMIKKWQDGALIVYGRRTTRDTDMLLKKITAQYYYRFMEYITDICIPHNVADFRLLDRKVLNEINKCKDQAPFLRGLIAWTGFKNEFVDYHCNERLHGTSGYTWKKMIRLALDGIIGFSDLPIKCAAILGIGIVSSGLVALLYIIIKRLFFAAPYPALVYLVTLNYILVGLLFIFIWFVGEYILRIYSQQRGRPLYIIEKEIS